jgi:hypothetical protein
MTVPQKQIVTWEIDRNLLSFIRLLKAHQKKNGMSESEFVNQLLAFAMSKIMGLSESNPHGKAQ